MKKIITIFLILIFGTLAGCSNTTSNKNDTEKTAQNVWEQLFELEKKSFTPQLSLSGTIEPGRKTFVASKIIGRVQEMYVDTGDEVVEGHLLATLTNDEALVDVYAAKSDYSQLQELYQAQNRFLTEQEAGARKQFERAQVSLESSRESLTNTEAISEERLKLAKIAVEQAELTLQNARQINVQKVKTLYDSSLSTIKSAQITVVNAHAFAGNLVEKDGGRDNYANRYDAILGVLDSQSKYNARSTYITSQKHMHSFVDFYEENIKGVAIVSDFFNDGDLVISTSSEQDSSKKFNYSSLNEVMRDMLKLLEATQETISKTYCLLENTISSSILSEDIISQWKSSATTHLFSLENAIQGLNNSGVKGWLQSLDTTLEQIEVEESSLESQFVNAQQALKEMEAVQVQNYSNASSRVQVSETEVDSAQLGVASAEAYSESSLQELNRSLLAAMAKMQKAETAQNELFLRAPFAGIIREKRAEQGQLVGIGQELFEIYDPTELVVHTSIPDVWAGRKDEDTARIQITVQGISDSVFPGIITKINPAVDPISRKLGLEIALGEMTEDIKFGMLANINIELPEMEGYFVPTTCVKAGFDGPYIVLEDDQKQIVQRGFEENGTVQISYPGIQAGISVCF